MNLVRTTTAALAMAVALTSTVAADARPYRGGYGHHGYYRHHGGGIGVGGALLGAAIIGGIAVAASNANRDRSPVYQGNSGPPPEGYADRDGYDSRGGYDQPEVFDRDGTEVDEANAGPVEDCSRAAEREAQSRGGYARVTGIDRVDPIEGGANVLGTLEVTHGSAAPAERLGWSCRAADGRVTGIRLG